MDATAKPHVTKFTLPPRLAYADGVVYASQGKLYALDAATGRMLRDYDVHATMALTVVAGVIYTGKSTKNAHGEYTHSYQATSAATGDLIWDAPVNGRPYYAPLVVDDTVVVAVVEGVLYGLDRQTGTERWSRRPDGFHAKAPVEMGGMLYVSPVVNDPNQAFVYALDASSGWQRWYRGLPESSSERLAVHGDALYVVMPNGGGLLALDRRLGVPAWRQPLEALPVSAPVALDDTVYLVASRTRLNPRVLEDFPDDATALPDPYPRSVVVVAMRAEDGTKRWEQTIGVEGAVTHAGEPVIGGAETIYVGANDGALYAFDATTGAPRWRYQTGGDQVSTPLIAGESAYVGASDGYVYALDAATGVLRWRAFTNTDVYGAASMRVGSLHIGGVKRKNDAE